MIELTILLLLAIASLVVAVYLVGFRMGGEEPMSALTQVQVEAAHAAREMHDLTRSAFVAMAEEAERLRRCPTQGDGKVQGRSVEPRR